ncbi:unnamed protein product [Soboliphyme baturini]|uniref:TH1 domain-containing protein n=1 Tax=Soboliphyme baturini TaxID=241478 RepID=A0A183J339_9BILA|nr:unnamed protein product [Soboliphyme baturini]
MQKRFLPDVSPQQFTPYDVSAKADLNLTYFFTQPVALQCKVGPIGKIIESQVDKALQPEMVVVAAFTKAPLRDMSKQSYALKFTKDNLAVINIVALVTEKKIEVGCETAENQLKNTVSITDKDKLSFLKEDKGFLFLVEILSPKKVSEAVLICAFQKVGRRAAIVRLSENPNRQNNPGR